MAKVATKAKAGKAAEPQSVTSIKGFDHNLQCCGFQFEIGKTYIASGEIKACENGFHACENPFDVWSYYPIVDVAGRLSRYAEVEQSGDISRHGENSKIASGSITVKAEIFLPDFVRRAVKALIYLTMIKDESGDSAQIGSSGDSAKIVAEGKDAVIASAGPGTTVSGADGAWISIAEFVDRKCVGFATGCIGKDGLLQGVAYKAQGGKLIPA